MVSESIKSRLARIERGLDYSCLSGEQLRRLDVRKLTREQIHRLDVLQLSNEQIYAIGFRAMTDEQLDALCHNCPPEISAHIESLNDEELNAIIDGRFDIWFPGFTRNLTG